MVERVVADQGRSPRRRRVARRGISDSTIAEGANLNSDVEGRATARVFEPLSEVESDVGSRTDAPSDFTPANRMRDVSNTGRATAYEREYRLKLLHRMIMRNVPLDQIAKELEISLSTVIRDRRELYKRLRDAAQELDINELIGDSIGFYTEVKAMALRSASAHKVPLNMRLAAMRTGLAANNDMHRFLQATGVYDVLRFRARDTSGASDIEKLIAATEAVLGGAEEKDEMKSISDLPFIGEDEKVELLR